MFSIIPHLLITVTSKFKMITLMLTLSTKHRYILMLKPVNITVLCSIFVETVDPNV
jgi:hypothetical protein